MDAERWQRIQDVFHEALERPPGERRRFVEAACGTELALATEVLALLAEDARADPLLDRGLDDVAVRALAPESTPRTIGPYRLGEVLGEGGMGVVYLAERADLGKRVAIKLLRDAWLSPSRRERFAAEQRTLARLEHPSIARLLDADTLSDGTPWFAMEYVDGVPLQQHCAERGLTIRARLALFRDVCEAVQAAHQLAVIHRDLKPSNVLVTREGRPKLLDFGIAKSLEALESGADRTRTELRLMTPAYAAPEQFRGEGQGVHTDVYALGAMLFELLTGRPPFDLEGRASSEVARIVLEQEPEKPSTVVARAAVPWRAERGVSWTDLDVLCLTALQKEPVRRYRSVEALIRDVDHYLRGEPLEARPDTLGYRAGKFARRHWRALAIAAAVLVATVGMVTFYTLRLAAARNAALAEVRRTRAIQDFMRSMFQGGDPDAGPADSLRVVDVLDRGVRGARAFGHEPAIQGELYQTLGEVYRSLGLIERSDSLLRIALDVRRAKLGRDHPDIERSLIALGETRTAASRYDDAERLAREALALARRREGSDPAAVARAMRSVGEVLVEKGDSDAAIRMLEGALAHDSTAHAGATERGATLEALANAHFYAGHYALADSAFRTELANDRALHGDRHPSVAGDLINLGEVQKEWGRWPAAERYYREALAIYRGWYGEEHFEVAGALGMLGAAISEQGRLVEAREPIQRALSIREKLYGPDHPKVALTLDQLAYVFEEDHRYAEAEADYLREIAIERRAYHDRHPFIGTAYGNLGGMYMKWKRYADAERSFRESLRRYAETLPPGHLYFGIGHARLGRALLRQSRFAEAARETRAGYEVFMAQSEPATTWLEPVRADLVAEYEALGRAAEAAKFRAAQADSAGSAVDSARVASR